MKKRCKNCRHWLKIKRDPEKMGVCTSMEACSGVSFFTQFHISPIAPSNSVSAQLHTAPSYGCVFFEPKDND